MNNYFFNINNLGCSNGICNGLLNIVDSKTPPIIVCIGTDAVIGDSLGPLVGSMLNQKLQGETYVYGTLENPITAKEINILTDYLNIAHPNSKILAIDAALGSSEEIGLIKLSSTGVKPGLGANKDLKLIGDYSLVCTVSPKSTVWLDQLKGCRLGLIYQIAQKMVDGIYNYFEYMQTSD